MENNVIIYGLSDPRNGSIRYIGQTINPRQRLWAHIYESRSRMLNANAYITHKNHWINQLLRQNINPELKILLKVDKSIADTCEVEMIKHYSQFVKLSNAFARASGGAKQRTANVINFMKNNNPGKKQNKAVLQYDLNGNFISEYESSAEAGRRLNIDRASIGRFIKRKRVRPARSKYIWKYKIDLGCK